MAEKIYTLYSKKEDEDQRIDTFLKNQLEGFSRDKIQAIISEGDVKIGYKKVQEFSERVPGKAQITVVVDTTKNYKKAVKRKDTRKIHVIHEDADIIVIEKEPGVLSVPTQRKERNTAIFYVNDYIKQKYNKRTSIVFIVHRLDQATSGLLVFAKHKKAQQHLKKQFLDHSIDRKYAAIVRGNLAKQQGKIESYLKDSDDKYHKMSSTENKEDGKHAVTHYSVRKQLTKYALIEAKLETGKRNQIRVHFSELGHPIMGDTKYSSSNKDLYDMPRLALHAMELGFIHPKTEKKVHYKSVIPQVMKQFLENREKT